MKKQLNIAIIGFGGMGEWHCHQMKASKIMNVVGAVSYTHLTLPTTHIV